MEEKVPHFEELERDGLRVDRGALVLAILTLLGAGAAVVVALVWRWVDCSSESQSACSTGGLVQLWLALAGLVPAAAVLGSSFRRRGRQGTWLLVTIATYVIWLAVGSSLVLG